MGGMGIDFWLDLVEPEGRVPALVRAAALRVLLSVAISSSPHAKAYFLSSNRAVPVLLRLLRDESPQLSTVALNIVWVLAHNNQRALPLLRRLRAVSAISTM